MVVEFAEKSLVGKARSRPDLVKQVIDKARREGLLNTAQAALNRLDQPMALGYSSAGTIIALGKNMQGFKVGQRVACAGGGFAVHAEYNVVPRNLLTPLPNNVDFESAAFTTLGAIALHGFRLAEPQIGEMWRSLAWGCWDYWQRRLRLPQDAMFWALTLTLSGLRSLLLLDFKLSAAKKPLTHLLRSPLTAAST